MITLILICFYSRFSQLDQLFLLLTVLHQLTDFLNIVFGFLTQEDGLSVLVATVKEQSSFIKKESEESDWISGGH